MKWAKVWPQDLGTIQRRIEVVANDILAATPFVEAAVAPDNRIVQIKEHHAVGHALQDPFVLQQLAETKRLRRVTSRNVDSGVLLASKAQPVPEVDWLPPRSEKHRPSQEEARARLPEVHELPGFLA